MKKIITLLIVMFAFNVNAQTVIQHMNQTRKAPQYNVGVAPQSNGQTQPVLTPSQHHNPRKSSIEVYRVQQYTPNGRENRTIWIQNEGNGRTTIREWDR